MSTSAERSQIAVLNVQMKGVQNDISEMKTDMKEIKTLLLTSSDNAVQRHEFEAYKKEQRTNRWLQTIGTILITAVVTGLVFAVFGVKHQ